MSNRPTRSDLAEEIVRRFPKSGNLTLARMLYAENKKLFSNLEAARSAVRYVRGAGGIQKAKRRRIEDRRELRSHKDPFGSLPDGIYELNEREPLFIEGAARIGVLSDIHVPYHEKGQVIEALKHCRKLNPTHLVLNGDIADFFAVSFWDKDPRERDLANEIKVMREFLGVLRKQFPKCEIIYKLGNHEERWERYLRVKAPEILGVPDFEIDKILRFADHGIQIVSDCRPIRAGHLNIIHGHEFRWGIQSPVNPARGFYQRGKECCLGGHLHQTSSHNEKSMNDVIIACWSTGCLCDLKPRWARMNKWNHGFATVEVDKSGMFQVHNYKLIHGRVFES